MVCPLYRDCPLLRDSNCIILIGGVKIWDLVLSIVERYLIQCPLFGVSVKRDSTVIHHWQIMWSTTEAICYYMFAEYGYSSCDKKNLTACGNLLLSFGWSQGLWTSNVIFCAGCVCLECIWFSLEKKRVMYQCWERYAAILQKNATCTL